LSGTVVPSNNSKDKLTISRTDKSNQHQPGKWCNKKCKYWNANFRLC